MTGAYVRKGGFVICPRCGKRCYNSRKEARRIARQIPGGFRLNAYRCTRVEGEGDAAVTISTWHLGKLPHAVIDGTVGRDKVTDHLRTARDDQ